MIPIHFNFIFKIFSFHGVGFGDQVGALPDQWCKLRSATGGGGLGVLACFSWRVGELFLREKGGGEVPLLLWGFLHKMGKGAGNS